MYVQVDTIKNLSHLNFTIKKLYYRKYSILRIFLYTLKTMNQKLHRQLNFYIPLTTYNRCTCQQLSQKAELVLCSISWLIWLRGWRCKLVQELAIHCKSCCLLPVPDSHLTIQLYFLLLENSMFVC